MTFPLIGLDQIKDDYTARPASRSHLVYRGHVWDVVSEDVDLGPAGTVTRDFIKHPGAVAVLAMRGETGAEEILLIEQYRHPIGAREWEIPAGLMDVAGEPAYKAALRELDEEADLRADEVKVLIDYASSPGGSSEQLRVFLARGLSDVPEGERFVREDEEADMRHAWARLDDVVEAVLHGQVHCPSLVVGALAAYASRAEGWQSLRPAETPWDVHPEAQ